MTSVLVIAEMNGNTVSWNSTARAVNAVSAIGPVDLLVWGEAVEPSEAATIAGVARVRCLNSPSLAHGLADAVSAAVVAVTDGYRLVAAPSSTASKDYLPRVAAKLDVMVIQDVSAVIDRTTFERPIYAGNAIQRIQTRDEITVLTIRTASFAAANKQAPAPIETLDIEVDPSSLVQWVSDARVQSERPELTAAATVVAGGRAIGSAENFALLEDLAETLDAGIGASRAAVDSGFAPNDWQIGQTGKVIAPDLYIGMGISGAIQHMAGIKDSRCIVAINKDSEAPIFQQADVGLIGDLFEIAPALTSAITAYKAQQSG